MAKHENASWGPTQWWDVVVKRLESEIRKTGLELNFLALYS